jgi:hypothetical protein
LADALRGDRVLVVAGVADQRSARAGRDPEEDLARTAEEPLDSGRGSEPGGEVWCEIECRAKRVATSALY